MLSLKMYALSFLFTFTSRENNRHMLYTSKYLLCMSILLIQTSAIPAVWLMRRKTIFALFSIISCAHGSHNVHTELPSQRRLLTAQSSLVLEQTSQAPAIQHKLGASCSSAQGKGMFFHLPK